MKKQFNIPILSNTTEDEFFKFWSNHYQYSDNELYDSNIGKAFTEERVINLFKWKNGRNLSKSKNELVRRIYIRDIEKQINSIEEGRQYILNMNDSGKVWDIFWLHCINPKLFPIFDQHTCRSMADIEGVSMKELDRCSRDEMIEIYFSKYIPFITELGSDLRYIDKALFAYGKFLKAFRGYLMDN